MSWHANCSLPVSEIISEQENAFDKRQLEGRRGS